MDPDLWALLCEVYATGRTLEITQTGNIGVKDSPLRGPLRDRLRANKAGVTVTLRTQRIGERTEYPSPLPRIYVVPAACPVAEVCHRLGPCGPPGTLGTCDPSPPRRQGFPHE